MLRLALKGIASALLLTLGLPSLWLLLTASSNRGRLIALTGLAAAAWPWLIVGVEFMPETTRRVRVGSSAALVVGLFLILAGAPTGTPPTGSPVMHRFTGEVGFQRFAIANLMPEIEQLNVGFLIAPYIDPIIDRPQAAYADRLTRNIYSEMELDPSFQALGSVMGLAYADVLGGSPDAGHYYLYIPRHRPPGPLPVLIFLHGSGGNFKAYTYLLSGVAEERGLVVIAPSFGFGNWRQHGGVESIERALDDAATVVEIDRSKVVLAGLSNGGLGVSLAAAQHPERYRGLIFLSPVVATEVADRPEFSAAWRGRPMLVITGEADDRIPVDYVRRRAEIWSAGGVHVTLITYPGQNHFLIFDRRHEVMEQISSWLAAVLR